MRPVLPGFFIPVKWYGLFLPALRSGTGCRIPAPFTGGFWKRLPTGA